MRENLTGRGELYHCEVDLQMRRIVMLQCPKP